MKSADAMPQAAGNGMHPRSTARRRPPGNYRSSTPISSNSGSMWKGEGLKIAYQVLHVHERMKSSQGLRADLFEAAKDMKKQRTNQRPVS
jgi:hypothetical protein